jgi:hypothetical protein
MPTASRFDSGPIAGAIAVNNCPMLPSAAIPIGAKSPKHLQHRRQHVRQLPQRNQPVSIHFENCPELTNPANIVAI